MARRDGNMGGSATETAAALRERAGSRACTKTRRSASSASRDASTSSGAALRRLQSRPSYRMPSSLARGAMPPAMLHRRTYNPCRPVACGGTQLEQAEARPVTSQEVRTHQHPKAACSLAPRRGRTRRPRRARRAAYAHPTETTARGCDTAGQAGPARRRDRIWQARQSHARNHASWVVRRRALRYTSPARRATAATPPNLTMALRVHARV